VKRSSNIGGRPRTAAPTVSERLRLPQDSLVAMPVASGLTPYRPKRWTKGDGFWNKADETTVGADGFRRLGTDQEIMSWPGITPQVRTEADEAVAQRRLKKNREALRNSVIHTQMAAKAAAARMKARKDAEWAERQHDALTIERWLERRKKHDEMLARHVYQHWERIEDDLIDTTARLFGRESPYSKFRAKSYGSSRSPTSPDRSSLQA
jgi:hypothetical protein